MLVLGIETSCDETSVAVLDLRTKYVISHQIATHDMSKYQGVVPEQAARNHLALLPDMIKHIDLSHVDLVAAASTPGLLGGLTIGTTAAKALAVGLGRPYCAVDHIKAHCLSVGLEHELDFPYIAFVLSGGHSLIVLVNSYTDFELLGQSLDDALGELFDKIGRQMNLGFPAGREVEKLARQAVYPYSAPVPKTKNPLDFSFSGLKTHFLTGLKHEVEYAQICLGIQAVAVKILIHKLNLLLTMYPKIHTYALVGGVACNMYIRTALVEYLNGHSCKLLVPSPTFCTDNAAMIAFAAREASDLRTTVQSRLNWCNKDHMVE